MISLQEMFMLFFSILYGIMLNSLIGRGAFPITSALSCRDMVRREKLTKQGEERGYKEGRPIWETGNTSWRRLLLSIGLLNLAPLAYFAVAFQLIDNIGNTISLNFVNAMFQIFSIGLISLSVFAFYYFFLGLVILKICGKPFFYTELHWEEQYREKVFYPSIANHLFAGFLYLAVPWAVACLFKIMGFLS